MANGLKNEGLLGEADKQWLQIANANANAAYADPTTVVANCYDLKLNRGARSWFKAESTQLIDMTAAYLDLLDRHNIPWMALRTRNPGRLVYEDEVKSSQFLTLIQTIGRSNQSGRGFPDGQRSG